MRPAHPAYTPPEHVTAVASALERARAAGLDYRTRFGRLPTRREVMDAVGVSESTATRALRPLKADQTRGRSSTPPPTSRRLATLPAAGSDRAGVEHDDESRPAAQDAAAARHRARGAHLPDVGRVREADTSQRPVTDASTRHPVRVTGRSATSAAPPAPHADLGRAAAVDTYASNRTRRPPRQPARADEHAIPPSTLPPRRARLIAAAPAEHRRLTCRSPTPGPRWRCWPRTEPCRRSAARRPSTTTPTRWPAGTPTTEHRTHADARSDAEGMCLQ